MKKRSLFIINLFIFAFILIYFTQISPIVPFDGDDWHYLGGFRLPFPLWRAWNPTRVLPEVLSPLGGYIAAFCVYPFNHDYVGALSFVSAFIVSIFVLIFLYFFYKFLIKRIGLTSGTALAGELFLLMSFFLLFKHIDQPSYGAFWTVDLSCDFFYVIPGLLNATMVFYMAQFDNFTVSFMQKSNLKKGLIILSLYFTLFSSTQLTIILASYCFVRLLIFTFSKGGLGLKQIINIQYWKRTWLLFSIILVWLLTIFFDLHGQRAQNVSSDNAKNNSFLAVINQMQNLFYAQNKKFVLLFCLLIIVALIVTTYLIVKGKNLQAKIVLENLITYIICGIISLVYLLLAYFKAGNQYASRPDAMWAVIFFFLFSGNVAFIWLISKLKLQWGLPLLLVISALMAFNFDTQNIMPTNSQYDAKTAKRVDNYIIDQVVKADREGKNKVIVKVPLDSLDADPQNSSSNWPHSYAMGTWLQNALYAHHIIRTRMQIIFKPDRKVNHQFYENKKNQQPFASIE